MLRFLGFQWLCWFSRMLAISPNFCGLTSRHFDSTGDHFLTMRFFLLSCRTAARCMSTSSVMGRRTLLPLSIRCLRPCWTRERWVLVLVGNILFRFLVLFNPKFLGD